MENVENKTIASSEEFTAENAFHWQSDQNKQGWSHRGYWY